MPIYEYKCNDCGKIHEIIQKFSDAPIIQCPSCNGLVKKMVSNTSFVLKGSGWYVTDYPSNDRKKEMASSSAGASDSLSSASSSAGASDSLSSTSSAGASDSGSKEKSSDNKETPSVGSSHS
jgi:putative FmdB family regulatory protein